jgi:hypothetical protein
MAAKDKYHDVVVRALEKDGWHIMSQQEKIGIDKRRIYIDLRATRGEDTVAIQIIVEVKGFENMPSPVDYLESAVGQYVLYRAILETKEPEVTLYLAVPAPAYNGILSEEIGQIAIQKLNIKLIVFDTAREEIVLWIN